MPIKKGKDYNWVDDVFGAPQVVPDIPAPPRPRPAKPAAEEPRFVKENFPTHPGYYRIGVDEAIKKGDCLVITREVPNPARHAYTMDPETTIRILKKRGYGDYDAYWVYRKGQAGAEGVRQYISKVKPLPLP